MAESIRIDGLRELNAALKRADTELPKRVRLELNDAIAELAKEVAGRFPRRSGRAAGSVRPRSTRTAARLAMGGARAPYAAWLDFGGAVGRKRSVRRRFYQSGRYLWPTFAKRKPDILARLERALVEVAREAGFDT